MLKVPVLKLLGLDDCVTVDRCAHVGHAPPDFRGQLPVEGDVVGEYPVDFGVRFQPVAGIALRHLLDLRGCPWEVDDDLCCGMVADLIVQGQARAALRHGCDNRPLRARPPLGEVALGNLRGHGTREYRHVVLTERLHDNILGAGDGDDGPPRFIHELFKHVSHAHGRKAKRASGRRTVMLAPRLFDRHGPLPLPVKQAGNVNHSLGFSLDKNNGIPAAPDGRFRFLDAPLNFGGFQQPLLEIDDPRRGKPLQAVLIVLRRPADRVINVGDLPVCCDLRQAGLGHSRGEADRARSEHPFPHEKVARGFRVPIACEGALPR